MAPPRPTRRCVLEDLANDIRDDDQRREVQDGRLPHVSVPLHSLNHPIVGFAAERFADTPPDPSDSIRSVRDNPWWKCRFSRWRGVVLWRNPDEQCWLGYVGYRREGDPDDAYAYFTASCSGAGGVDSSHYLPVEDDLTRLAAEELYAKKVEAAREVRDAVITSLLAAVGSVPSQHEVAVAAGRIRLEVLPLGDLGELRLSVEVDWQEEGAGDLLVAVLDAVPGIAEDEWEPVPAVGGHASPLWIALVNQEWVQKLRDAADEHGVAALAADPTLAADEPDGFAHIVRRDQVTRASVEGRMLRTVCGRRIVPRHDWRSVPECPSCADTYAAAQRALEAAREFFEGTQ